MLKQIYTFYIDNNKVTGDEETENDLMPCTGYFRDGKTRIDLICVVKNFQLSSKNETILTEYFKRTVKLGFKLEVEQGQMPEHIHLSFVKIHATDEFLEKHGYYFGYVRHFKDMHKEFIGQGRICPYFPIPPVQFEKAYMCLIREHYPGPFGFSTLDRSRILYEYLLNVKLKVGCYNRRMHCYSLKDMLDKKLVLDVYALHDGPYFLVEAQKACFISGRQVLFENWTGLGNLFRVQPLHIVSEYLGEKIGVFFGFYNFYTLYLIFPAIVGILVYYFDWVVAKMSEVTIEICIKSRAEPARTERIGDDERLRGHHDYVSNLNLNFAYINNIYICPNCRHFALCPYRYIRDFCEESKLIDTLETRGRLYLLPTLVFFWAAIVFKLWRRKEKYLIWLWEVDAEYVKSTIRMYCKGAHYDFKRTYLRSRLWTLLWNIIQATCLLLFAVLICHGLIHYRYFLMEQYASIKPFWRRKYYTLFFLGITNMMIVFATEYISKVLIKCLINLEQPDTNADREFAIAVRLFTVSFVSTFTFISYVAFVKGQFYKSPTDEYTWWFWSGILLENCQPLTCMDEVLILIVSIVIMREFVIKFLPYMCCFGAKSDYSDIKFENNSNYPYYERERLMYTDVETDYFLTQKYNEIVIQFASVTLFVGVFPLGPALALITNIIDIRFCARRILLRSRRPLLPKSIGIGPWRHILLFLVFLMGLFNTLVITVTSDAIVRMKNLDVETKMFDHINYLQAPTYHYYDYTVLFGYNNTIDKQIKIGHIPLKLFSEFEYQPYERKLDSPYKEYMKYEPNGYSVTNLWCDFTEPPPYPMLGVDDLRQIYPNDITYIIKCSKTYQLMERRFCYYRGFSKKYGHCLPGATTIVRTEKYTVTDSLAPPHYPLEILYPGWYPGFTGVSGLMTRGFKNFDFVFGFRIRSITRTWYPAGHIYQGHHWWDWRFYWSYYVVYFANVCVASGSAENWQAVYLSSLKWWYTAVLMVAITFVLVLIYFCWPDSSYEVVEGLATETNFTIKGKMKEKCP